MSNVAGNYHAANGDGTTDPSGLEAGQQNGQDHAAPALNGGNEKDQKQQYQQQAYRGGSNLGQAVTPGGHTINDELLAIGTAPRKIANPLPLGVMAFATTTLLLSLYNVGVRGIAVPNEIITYALA